VKEVTLQGTRIRKAQRYHCNDCGALFQSQSSKLLWDIITRPLGYKAVHLTFDTLGSLRKVARELKRTTGYSFHPHLVLDMILELAKGCKDSFQIKEELQPHWSGYLGFDGTCVKIFGQKYTLLVGRDLKTQDLVHWRLMPHEDYQCIRIFLKEIRDKLFFPTKGIVADLDPANKAAMTDVYPHVPYQACISHIEKDVNLQLPKTKRTRQQKQIKKIIREVLYARSKRLSIRAYMRLLEVESQVKNRRSLEAIRIVKDNFLSTLTHFDYPQLPASNNVVENVVGQLKEKIKLTRGFKKTHNAYYFLKLLACWYRFKRFESSNYPERNGKSPLELCHAKQYPLDWVKWCQRNH